LAFFLFILWTTPKHTKKKKAISLNTLQPKPIKNKENSRKKSEIVLKKKIVFVGYKKPGLFGVEIPTKNV
jgi:hypothetical protein